MSTSAFTDRELRQDAAGSKRQRGGDCSSGMLDPTEAAAIAGGLIAKYGSDALAFSEDRAERAQEVGDDLALAAWGAVIAETRRLLSTMAEA